MLDKRSYYELRPDAPKDLRIFGDSEADEKKNFVIPKKLLGFGVESFSAIQPGLQTPSLISSFEGKIKKILFCFPKNRSAAQIAVYKSLIAELGQDTELVIAYNETMRADIEAWLNDIQHPLDKVEWAPIPDFVSLTHWAEDAYVGLKDTHDDQEYLMEPWSFLRGGDQLIADAVDDYTDIQAKQAPLYFQGGNCLIGDDFWILGADYFEESKWMINKNKLPIKPVNGQTVEDSIIKAMKEYLDADRKLFLTGTTKAIPIKNYYPKKENGGYVIDIPSKGVGDYQPIFHIDMMITLLGRNDNGKFELLVADPKLGNQMAGYADSPFNLSYSYDKIAKDFEDAGFIVHRNPLVHHAELYQGQYSVKELTQSKKEDIKELGNELIALGAGLNDVPKIRDWHHITWNNCLIENKGNSDKHVYLPTFGHGNMAHLSSLDDAMEAQFSELGFTVHRLADCNEFALSMGVVHCISKYLKRG